MGVHTEVGSSVQETIDGSCIITGDDKVGGLNALLAKVAMGFGCKGGYGMGRMFRKEEDPTGSDSVNVLKRALNVDSLAGSGVENGIPKSWPLEPRRIIASVEGIKVHMEELKAAGRIDPGFSVERVVHNGLAEEALSEL